MLGALWCVVQLIGEPSMSWAGWACGLWLTGVTLAAHVVVALASRRVTLRGQASTPARSPPRSPTGKHAVPLQRRRTAEARFGRHLGAAPYDCAPTGRVRHTQSWSPAVTIAALVASAGPVALLALAPGIVAALFYLVAIPRMAARHSAESADVMGDIVTAVDDYARGIRVCRIYGAQTGAAADYAESTARFTRGMQERVRLVATPCGRRRCPHAGDGDVRDRLCRRIPLGCNDVGRHHSLQPRNRDTGPAARAPASTTSLLDALLRAGSPLPWTNPPSLPVKRQPFRPRVPPIDWRSST